MPQLEPLQLKLTGNADGLSAALGKAQGSVGGFGLSLDGLTNGLSGKLSGMAAAFNPVSIAIAAGLAVVTAGAAAAAMAIGNIREALDRVDAANDAANRLGVSLTERAKLMVSVGEATGADSGAIDSAIVKLQTSLGEAAQKGSGKAFDALERLGLDAGELLAAGPMRSIEMIAERVSSINDRAAQTSIVFDLLGRQGMAIAAAFRESPEGLREAAAWAERNLSLTQQQVEQIGMANDVWGRMGMKLEAIWNQIAADLAPAFQMVGEDVLYWVEQLGNAGLEVSNLTDAFAAAYGVATDLGEVVVAIGSTLYETWAAGVRIIKDFVTSLIEALGVIEIIDAALGMIGETWDSLVNKVASFLPMDALSQVFGEEAMARMQKNWSEAMNFDGISKSLDRLEQIRKEAAGRDRSGISDAMAETLEMSKGVGEAFGSAAGDAISLQMSQGIGSARAAIQSIESEVAKLKGERSQLENQLTGGGAGDVKPLRAITDRAEQIRAVADMQIKKDRTEQLLQKLNTTNERIEELTKRSLIRLEALDNGPIIDLD